MGCSYYADIVVGIRLCNLNPLESHEVIMTLDGNIQGVIMNPDGTVPSRVCFTHLGNSKFEGSLEKIISMLSENYRDKDKNFINPFEDEHPCCYYYGNIDDGLLVSNTNENIVLGFRIHDVNQYDDTVVEIDLKQVDDAKSKMEDWLKRILKIKSMDIGTYAVMGSTC